VARARIREQDIRYYSFYHRRLCRLSPTVRQITLSASVSIKRVTCLYT
jgi:hypothetical protein